MGNLILGLTFFLSSAVGAATVEDKGRIELKKLLVKAENVKAIEVTFAREFTRGDCNSYALNLKNEMPVKIDGNDMNWNKTLFVDYRIIGTEAYCPIPEPVTEVIRSETLTYESFSNRYIDGEVELLFMLPPELEIEVKEIR